MPVSLKLKFLEAELLPAALELDIQCLGGLWTLEGYQRELDSPNSQLLALTCPVTPGLETDSHTPQIQSQSILQRLVGLGCLWSVLEEAHITLLAVHPQYRCQGFGQALLHRLLMIARRQQLEWATLEVRESNQVALSLYQKFGFQEVGRRRRYYPDTNEDGLVLWRQGLQLPEFKQALGQWQEQINQRLLRKGWLLETSLLNLPGNPKFYAV